MKNFLGVLGSPRMQGNTHILISKILESARKMGATGEIKYIYNLNIKEYDGCYSCWNGNECSKNDDMNKLYQKIFESDIIIFGTRINWYGPTDLIKAFLDRLIYVDNPNNKSKMEGKSAVLVIPFEENDLEIANPIVEMFDKSLKYMKMKIIESLIVLGVFKKGDVHKKAEVLERAIKIGEKIGKSD